MLVKLKNHSLVQLFEVLSLQRWVRLNPMVVMKAGCSNSLKVGLLLKVVMRAEMKAPRMADLTRSA